MELERAVFRIYDRTLTPFSDEILFENTQLVRQRRCNGKRFCAGLQGCTIMVALIAVSMFGALHNAFAYQQGCVTSLLGTALTAWAANPGVTGVAPGTSLSAFLQPTDVLRVGVDWLRVGCPWSLGEDTGGSYQGCVAVTQGPLRDNTTLTSPLVYIPAGSSLLNPVPNGYISAYLYSPSSALVSLATQGELPQTGQDYLTTSTVNSYRRIHVIVPPTCPSDSTAGRSVLNLYEVLFSTLYSYDTVLINDLQWGMRGGSNGSLPGLQPLGGFLRSLYTGEDWNWSPADTQVQDVDLKSGGGLAFLNRLDMLLRLGLGGFFLLSVINAVLIRVLFSSGVAIMYGMAYSVAFFIGRGRMPNFMSQLNLAYPWLGVHAAGLAQAGAPVSPLLWANLAWCLLVFILYQSTAASLNAFVLGWKSYPSALPPALWTLFALLEVFSYVFLRSKEGMRLYPRLVMVLWLLWVCYYVRTPYGFSVEALSVLGFMCLAAAVLVVSYYEIPALAQERVSEEKPRETMVQLGQHEIVLLGGVSPGLTIPPLWTVVHPLQDLTGGVGPTVSGGAQAQQNAGAEGGNAAPDRPAGPLAGAAATATVHGGASEDATAQLLAEEGHSREEPLLLPGEDEGGNGRPVLVSQRVPGSRR